MKKRIAKKIITRWRGEPTAYGDGLLSTAQRAVLGLKLPPFNAGARVMIVSGIDIGQQGTVRSRSAFGTLRVELDGEEVRHEDGTPFCGYYMGTSVAGAFS